MPHETCGVDDERTKGESSLASEGHEIIIHSLRFPVCVHNVVALSVPLVFSADELLRMYSIFFLYGIGMSVRVWILWMIN